MKSECPTYLKSKGKVMVVTLSDDESLVVMRMETSLLSQLLL